jgi:hypothetical protein
MTIEEKLSIARGTVTPLLRKIRAGKNIGLNENEVHDVKFI